jgi:hypothetical protein
MLVVTHVGTLFVHQFTSKGKSVASWAALYGNCPHHMEPITTGCHLTLMFNLVHNPKLKDQQYVSKYYYPKATQTKEQSAVPKESVTVMTTCLLKAVEAHCALAKPLGKRKPLGIMLSHHYISNKPTLAGLKGVDQLVANAIRSVRRVQLLPVLVYHHLVTDKWEYDPKSKANVVAFTRPRGQPPPSAHQDAHLCRHGGGPARRGTAHGWVQLHGQLGLSRDHRLHLLQRHTARQQPSQLAQGTSAVSNSRAFFSYMTVGSTLTFEINI